MQEAAGQKLDDYRADFGAFIESATDGELTGDVVAENLQMHVDMLIVAVDDVLAGSPDVYAKLQAAADAMPPTAQALTGRQEQRSVGQERVRQCRTGGDEQH